MPRVLASLVFLLVVTRSALAFAVFQAKTGGYMLHRIPCMVVTAKGTVLASCEARKNDRGDWGPIDILLRRSIDGGRTWPVNKSLEAGFSGYSDLAVLPDGTILCFYEHGSLDGKNTYATGLLTVARFTLEWLTDGADTAAAK
jgi:hypothetical protein